MPACMLMAAVCVSHSRLKTDLLTTFTPPDHLWKLASDFCKFVRKILSCTTSLT